MDNYRLFDQLLAKYLLETITEEETRQFFDLLEDPSCQALLTEDIGRHLAAEKSDSATDRQVAMRIKARLAARRRSDRKGAVIRISRFVATAAAVLFIAAGLTIWVRTRKSPPGLAARGLEMKKTDIAPGRDGAILTLADGSTIDLDSTRNGKIIQQGITSIVKRGGVLSYEGGGHHASAGQGDQPSAVLYNTVTVTAAHQIQLLLPDGSKVWLNASSTLSFPTAFTGRERRVRLTGEGYFEIAHKAGQPFVVTAAGIEVQDIGTQFDVMAYSDEPAIQTTLVEGSARVASGVRSALLRPNEQASIVGGAIAVQQNVNVEEAIAWKNGLFLVNGAGMSSVLRQIGRWYDVEIVFKGEIPKGHMIADIPRSMSLLGVMDLLRQFGIGCRLEGRQLIITG